MSKHSTPVFPTSSAGLDELHWAWCFAAWVRISDGTMIFPYISQCLSQLGPIIHWIYHVNSWYIQSGRLLRKQPDCNSDSTQHSNCFVSGSCTSKWVFLHLDKTPSVLCAFHINSISTAILLTGIMNWLEDLSLVWRHLMRILRVRLMDTNICTTKYFQMLLESCNHVDKNVDLGRTL